MQLPCVRTEGAPPEPHWLPALRLHLRRSLILRVLFLFVCANLLPEASHECPGLATETDGDLEAQSILYSTLSGAAVQTALVGHCNGLHHDFPVTPETGIR